MPSLTIEERRRRILTASPSSYLARSFPAVLKTGQAIISEHVDKVARLCCPDAANTFTQQDGCRVIVPLIKPAGDDCNLRCQYCNVRSEHESATVMSLDLIDKIIRELTAPPFFLNSIIFHGGEPMLAGIEFFRKATKIIQRNTRPGQKITKSLQTNATLIDRDWARFLAEQEFSVGVSLDGPSHVHDAMRRDAAGHGTHARVVEAIKMLREVGVEPNAIATIPAQPLISAPDMLEYMMSAGLPQWRINPCRTVNAIRTYPSFISELFQVWSSTLAACEIPTFTNAIEALLGYPPRACSMSGCCPSIMGFLPDGSVKPCCELPVARQHYYGNIRDESLKALLDSPAARRFQQDVKMGFAACEPCEWHDMCKGCSFLRIAHSGSAAGPDPLCSLYRETYARLCASFDAALTADGS